MSNQVPTERRGMAMGRALRSILERTEQGAVMTDALIEAMCQKLRENYEKTPACIYIVDKEIPGGPPRGGGKVPEGYDLPGRHPGDGREDVYEEVRLVSRCMPNQHKIDILNEALALGCSWAEWEMRKLEPKPIVARQDPT